MPQVKTETLSNLALNWAVCKAGGGAKDLKLWQEGYSNGSDMFHYSTDWAQGGPIIDEEGIELICNLNPAEAATFKCEPHWRASIRGWAKGAVWYGPTALVAAMRCYVASKLGDTVEIPAELT